MSVTPPSNLQRRNSIQAFGLAMLIEAAIVVAAGAILIGNAQVKPAISEPVPITLTDIPPEEKPPEPKPLPPPPEPQPKVKQVVKQVVPRPLTPPPPQATPQLASAPTQVTEPTAFTQPVAATVPPPPAPPVNTSKADATATYWGKVNAAVQASHAGHYPSAAVMVHFNGKTQVEFHLQDGILVGEPRLLVSCGNGMFDQSALQAVQLARYPMPPEELRGENKPVTIWVHFDEH